MRALLLAFLSAPLLGADIDTVLRQGVGAKGVPAVVAAVGSRDKVIYQGAHGNADLKTVFRIFSMTKAVTSVAAMQLVEQGKVDLDAPVDRYLPELAELKILRGFGGGGKPVLAPAKRRPTIRQLLSHTGGYGYGIWDELLEKYPTSGGFMKAPLVTEPGTRWQYGVNTDVVGRVVETVSGEGLEDYFQRHIFKPLGMTETTFYPTAEMQVRLVKLGRRQADGSYKEEQVPVPAKINPSGGGGLYSTAGDYLKFLRMFLRGGEGVLQAGTIEAMRSNQIGELMVRRMVSTNQEASRDFGFHIESGDKFGLGFQINPVAYNKGRAAGSMAWAGFWNTFFWIDPKSDRCAVILMQTSPFFDEPSIRTLQAFEAAVYGHKPR